MPPKPFQTTPPPGNQMLQMLKPMGEILRRASSVEIGCVGEVVLAFWIWCVNPSTYLSFTEGLTASPEEKSDIRLHMPHPQLEICW